MYNATLKKHLDRVLENIHLLQALTLTGSDDIELKLRIAEDIRIVANKIIQGYRRDLDNLDKED